MIEVGQVWERVDYRVWSSLPFDRHSARVERIANGIVKFVRLDNGRSVFVGLLNLWRWRFVHEPGRKS